VTQSGNISLVITRSSQNTRDTN